MTASRTRATPRQASMVAMAKSTSAGKAQFNVYLPPELVRAVRHRAIDEGRSASALVEAALVVYLDTESRPQGGDRSGA